MQQDVSPSVRVALVKFQISQLKMLEIARHWFCQAESAVNACGQKLCKAEIKFFCLGQYRSLQRPEEGLLSLRGCLSDKDGSQKQGSSDCPVVSHSLELAAMRRGVAHAPFS